MKASLNKLIDIETVDIDRYGRTVGIVRAVGAVINCDMVKIGYAWVYEQYFRQVECRDRKANQAQSREEKIIGSLTRKGGQATFPVPFSDAPRA